MKTLNFLFLSLILLVSFNTKAVNHNLVLDPYGVFDMDNTGTYIGTTTSTYTVNIGDSLTFTSSFAAQTSFKINTTNLLYMTSTGTYYYLVTGLDVPSFNISKFINSNGTGNLSLLGTIHVNCVGPTINVNSATICAGTTTTLTPTGTATTYTWSTGSNTPSISVTPPTTTVYTVSGTSTGCSIVTSQTVTVNVNDLPIVSLSSVGPMCVNSTPVTLVGTPSNGTYTGTGVVGSSFDPSISGAGTFNITYSYTDINSCTNSVSQPVIVNACVGMKEYNKIQFNSYPNPVADELTINSDSKLGQVTITNLIGQVVYSANCNDKQTTVDVRGLKAGVYVVSVGGEIKKFIKN